MMALVTDRFHLIMDLAHLLGSTDVNRVLLFHIRVLIAGKEAE